MAAYFTLTKSGEDSPTSFEAIDAHLCEYFDTPLSDTDWYQGWYDRFGIALAVGKTWDEIRGRFPTSPPILEVIDYLEENYAVHSGHC